MPNRMHDRLSDLPRYEVVKGGTLPFRARIQNWNGEPLAQDDVDSIEMDAYVTDGYMDSSDEEAVENQTNVVVPDSAIGGLVVDDDWDEDDIGYNFTHIPAIDTHPLFTERGKEYVLYYKISLNVGQPIVVPFFVVVI